VSRDLRWAIARLGMVVVVAAPAVTHGGEEPIFASGFQTGTTCAWSATVPEVDCPEFETCAQAAASVWGCFEMPFAANPVPDEESGPGSPLRAQRIDAYFLIDRSGSMAAEITNLKNNLATVVDLLQCWPEGSGAPPDCVPDLWAGGGTIGFAAGSPYLNALDLQPSPNFSSLPTTEDAGCCSEATLLATWAAVTGGGTSESGCTATTFPARATCSGSPAANAGNQTFGYPCFREMALPVVLIYTDEAPSANLNCPLAATVVTAAVGGDARLVGMLGAGAAASVSTELSDLASGSGAVDTANGNAPLVFTAADANAAAATQSALLTLHAGVPLRSVTARFVDGTDDGVDLEAAFVDHVAAIGGGADCLTPYAAIDTDADTVADTYVEIPSGETLCWMVVAKQNVDVPATNSVQPFEARLDVVAGEVPLESLSLLFLVPVG
jgi:hypothetical protein